MTHQPFLEAWRKLGKCIVQVVEETFGKFGAILNRQGGG